jgi:hypothetical protein
MGMIGTLLGVPSLGWGVHLLFSAIIGAIFGAVVGDRPAGWAPASGLGAAYGVDWWILGPLLIMPTWLGMGPMVGHAFDGSNIMSLMGHLMYGVVTGAAYRCFASRKSNGGLHSLWTVPGRGVLRPRSCPANQPEDAATPYAYLFHNHHTATTRTTTMIKATSGSCINCRASAPPAPPPPRNMP